MLIRDILTLLAAALLSAGFQLLTPCGETLESESAVSVEHGEPPNRRLSVAEDPLALGPCAALVSEYCNGDGSGSTACPCGNFNDGSNGLAGCANGTNPGGGRLSYSGCASVAEKTLVLVGTGLPTCGTAKSALFFQGNSATNGGQGVPFYAGLRCASGGTIFLEKTTYDGAGNAWTTGNIAALGGVSPGDVKRYQIWYTDDCGCMGAGGYNLTNGLGIVWAP